MLWAGSAPSLSWSNFSIAKFHRIEMRDTAMPAAVVDVLPISFRMS